MTAAEMLPGPPCDICSAEPAVMSLLNYTDYAQMKLGPGCAPEFLRTIADSIDGRSTAQPEPESEPDPKSGSGSADGGPVSTSTGSESDDDGQGSAKDHWASTTNVRRSTHGHRTTTRRPATARKDEPE